MIDQKSIAMLREKIRSYVSEKRYIHSLGVEKMAVYIGNFCIPEKIMKLSAAALLHDITKELSVNDNLNLLAENNDPAIELKNAPKLLHSFTAPYIIKSEFPDFADEEILSAVRKHTLGSSDMTVFDEIIFISDFIEENRSAESCVKTRNFLIESLRENDVEKSVNSLHRACIMCIDLTVEYLNSGGSRVNETMLEAKNSLVALL